MGFNFRPRHYKFPGFLLGSVILAFALPVTGAETKMGTEPILKSLPCAAQVFSSLDHWETPTSWRKLPHVDPEVSRVGSPTEVVGVWLFVTVRPKELTVSRNTSHSEIQLRWELPGCAQEATVRTNKEASAANSFSDEDLRSRLKEKKAGGRGVIYVWSPHMPLSISGVSEIEALAKKVPFELILVLDPNASEEQARKVAEERKMPKEALRKVASLELVQREALYHYPAYVYFRDGKILGQARLGYDEPKRLEGQVKKRLLE